MEHLEIVVKLIGGVNPVGETSADNRSYENLKQMCDLADNLINIIGAVAALEPDVRYSVKRSAKYAQNFLDQLAETIKP